MSVPTRPRSATPRLRCVCADNARHRGGQTYVVQSGPWVKIGVSTDPVARWRSLRHDTTRRPPMLAGDREDITPLLVIPSDVEHLLHLFFRHEHVHGEWFRPTPEMYRYLLEWATAPETAALTVTCREAYYAWESVSA